MSTQDDIRGALKNCYDPEIPINIVDLGLVYGIENNDGAVEVTMTLTSMGCPVADQIKRDVETEVLRLDDVDHVSVDIVYDPPWTPEMVSEDGQQELSSMGIM